MVLKTYQDIDEFYGFIKTAAFGKASSVLILTANEIDAMSSTRMFAHLLKTDNIYFSIRMVSHPSHIKSVFDEEQNSMEDRVILLINCGATSNLPRLFDLEKGGNVRCFVMDNHRPFHLANIHSPYAVVVFDDSPDHLAEGTIPDDGSDLSCNENDSDDEDEEREDFDDADDDLDSEGDEISKKNDENEEEDITVGSEAEEEFEEADDEEKFDGASDIASDNEVEEKENEHDEEEAIAGPVVDAVVEEEIVDLAHTVEGDHQEEETDGERTISPDNVSGVLDEMEEGSRLSGHRRARESGEGGGDDGDGDDEEAVVRRRRPPDPRKVRRDAIRAYYRSGENFSGCPTAFKMLEVVKTQLNSNNIQVDLIWQAILGVTDQYIRSQISDEDYSLFVSSIRGEIADVINRDSTYLQEDKDTGGSIRVPKAETGQVRFIPDEFRFFMLRHWSLYDAMYYSPYVSKKMSTWRKQGAIKLQELLARIGVPLEQCNQHFNHMNPRLKVHFQKELSPELCEEYNLKDPEVKHQSFARYTAFKQQIACADIVYAASALLEASSSDRAHSMHAFNESYDSLGTLGTKSEGALSKGIKLALNIQKAILQKATLIIERNDIKSETKRIHFVYLSSASSSFGSAHHHARANNGRRSEGKGTNKDDSGGVGQIFERPQILSRLGRFIMDIKTAKDWKGSRKRGLPLLILSEKAESWLVVAVAPRATELDNPQAYSLYSKFRSIYTMAAKDGNFEHLLKFETFDTNVVEVGKDQKDAFLGNIIEILKKVLKPSSSVK